jgi:uncharacterized protein (DUF58 family)
MAELRQYLDPRAVAQLDRLGVVARSLVEGFLKGLHLSPAKGSSIEFAEHRPYVRGDEIRHIDWRTYGKTDRYYLKQYDDETNLRATLILDASASMGFGSSGASKLRYASCLAAALGYLLVSQRDAVGLAVVDSGVRRYVPPKATAEHLTGLFSAMEESRAEGKTALGPVIHRLAERLAARSLAIVLSDLLDEPEEILAALAHLRHRRSEVMVFQVLDPAEIELPFNGWMLLRDPEEPSRELRLDARQARRIYQENLEAHLEALRRGCAAAKVDYTLLATAEPFETALARYLHARAANR